MKNNRKKLAIALSIICLLGVGGLSKPGRSTVENLLSLLKGKGSGSLSLGSEPAGMAGAGQDVEQRARARHGWGGVTNAIVRGAITFFDKGLVRRQANITIYHKLPDRLRVEIEEGGLVEAFGFDGADAWKLRTDVLSEEEARDMRGWLRAWPDRLFVMRAAKAGYREVGSRVEDSRPPVPGQGQKDTRPAKEFDLVEIEDTIGLPATPRRAGDRRLISYLVDRERATVCSARWLEPDDPRQSADDGSAATAEMRVDFSGWRRVEGVLWPGEVVRWRGGKADFRIDVAEVLVNQPMPDTLFQNPNR